MASPPIQGKQKINIPKTALKNLIMGGTAGIIGACCTYPLDMVKTRLQNQKSGSQRMYKGAIHCFMTILKSEGVLGLYRGLPAQLVGITPEKAIKLTMNDLLRYSFTDDKGNIKLIHEGLSGAMAGACQVVVTTPYELVKVRLQTQGISGHARKSAFTIMNELGLRGMFTGLGATLLRDVPFSAIYFTTYGRLKKAVKDEKGHISTSNLFGCGVLAGALAASSVTPADVIKTRLQSGSGNYKGIVDCFSQIISNEGPKALFKGLVPRILIISPLFGITLAVYEVLQGYFL